ncbi:glycosyltransferase family 2 protein [Bradyrhizobium zhanjiangense]|uniref:glycosyltransferase family 2 protein n=1 Tax=Bradyrhizobium zhanjiangense TaxID=1325107 RepID=UPI001FE22395|nr:glycosyltransferase family 2 protein [Bradyrhizobium zhanjiangense]
MQQSLPHVSVVTPVFNGARYLHACIESVLAQTYRNWDYTIVDNCSTDRTLEIARQYARNHPQIRVQTNKEFVGAIENHNRAFRSISAAAKYCKLLSSDDWMYPECISKLVDVAERHPSAGIVSSYAINANGLRWGHMPLDEEIIDGREAARLFLLGSIDAFFTPSLVLYRASLVRSEPAFFPGAAPSADLEACLNCLKCSDLGFVHQILSYERIHDGAITARVRAMNSQLLDRLRILLEFGPIFLGPTELERRTEEQLSDYYKVLAEAFFNLRDSEFWKLHKAGLAKLGYSLYSQRFAGAVAAKFLDLALNPKATAEKVLRRMKTSSVRRPETRGYSGRTES